MSQKVLCSHLAQKVTTLHRSTRVPTWAVHKLFGPKTITQPNSAFQSRELERGNELQSGWEGKRAKTSFLRTSSYICASRFESLSLSCISVMMKNHVHARRPFVLPFALNSPISRFISTCCPISLEQNGRAKTLMHLQPRTTREVRDEKSTIL